MEREVNQENMKRYNELYKLIELVINNIEKGKIIETSDTGTGLKNKKIVFTADYLDTRFIPSRILELIFKRSDEFIVSVDGYKTKVELYINDVYMDDVEEVQKANINKENVQDQDVHEDDFIDDELSDEDIQLFKDLSKLDKKQHEAQKNKPERTDKENEKRFNELKECVEKIKSTTKHADGLPCRSNILFCVDCIDSKKTPKELIIEMIHLSDVLTIEADGDHIRIEVEVKNVYK